MAIDKATFAAMVAHVYNRLEPIEWALTQQGLAVKFAETASEEANADTIRTYIEWAEECPGAWKALCLIAARRLRKGDSLTPELTAWVADVLSGKEKPGHRKRGRPQENHNRDEILADLVSYVVKQFGLKHERNPKKNVGGARRKALPQPCFAGGSACDVVGVAAGRLGHMMSYSSIAGAYHRYSRHKPS